MNPPPSTSATRGARAAAGVRRAAASTAKARLDLRHQAGVRVEELLLHLRPAAQIVDGEELRPHREAEALGRTPDYRAITALREELLRGRRVEVPEKRLRVRLVLAFGRDCDRVVDPDRRLRDVEVHGQAGVLCEQRFVLVGQERIALAVEKRVQRVARRLVLHWDVVEERVEVLLRLLRRLAELELR